ncbi:hypothetical protein Rsub_04852 [Raphidocelis subcapitata]|uniref:Uncharacterized protein n=1 Tax=Raphidocelis subcapitata TaxID=307507 RepID=A0A2V0P014_9CHLO|nr:hypothetical protein Rsub_04852 [Raphidocelis subcapitata]|eukprot:GBF91183.1 hypothetical protein Rsub_04852 [Raphidocelis subcapitata]
MVYWGCSTARNRLAWAWVALAGSTGATLFVLGAARLDACNRAAASGGGGGGGSGSGCVASKAMLIAGSALMLLALPPILFFGGCAAPPSGDLEEGECGAGVTVVRQGMNGAALHYKYDGAGRLVFAPDRYTEAAIAGDCGGGGDWGGPPPAAVGPMTAQRWSQAGGDCGGGGGGGGGERSARTSDTAYLQQHQHPAGAIAVLPARSPRPGTPASSRASPAFDRRPATLSDYKTDPDLYTLPQ